MFALSECEGGADMMTIAPYHTAVTLDAAMARLTDLVREVQ